MGKKSIFSVKGHFTDKIEKFPIQLIVFANFAMKTLSNVAINSISKEKGVLLLEIGL
jgi:hypothetical protein